MRRRIGWAAASALALAGCIAVVQAQTQGAPIVSNTFEDNEEGWTALGNNAKASITHEPANVKVGKGALQFDYTVAKGEMSVLVSPVPAGTLASARSLRLWMKADHATTLAVVLQEKDGGRYLAPFAAPKGEWQQVELAPADFFLSDTPGDPRDPDGKLDMDQIEYAGIADLAVLIAQAGDTPLAALFDVKTGPHTLYVDDIVVGADALPPAWSAANGDVRIDTFARPQVSWLGIAGVRMSRAEPKPLEGRSLRMDYRQAPQKVAGAVRMIRPGSMKGVGTLSFDVAATKPARLVVQLEETDGGKYNAVVEVPGGSQPKHVTVAVADMTPADDSKDTNTTLDMDLVKQLVLIDASGLIDGADTDETLWLGNLRGSAK